MRILFIRHGDPDYIHDTVTEKGKREAKLLAELAPALQMGDCYVSPLGRARDTAAFSLEKLGKKAKTMDWLQEFPVQVDLNLSDELVRAYPEAKKVEGRYLPRIAWDMVPSYWTEHPEYMDPAGWRYSEAARCSNLVSLYDETVKAFDDLLAMYGCVRERAHYRIEKETTETITLFCHFGISCVLLSHLWNVSPFILWHSLVMAPSSVTEVVTEEREAGVAYFRAKRVGDVSHLYLGGEEPSFAARFCEVYSNWEQRH